MRSKIAAFASVVSMVAATVLGGWVHGGSGGTTPFFAHLPVGGGGYTSGIQCASDGTCVSRVDVYGTYICASSPSTCGSVANPWVLLDTEQTMPAGAVPNGGIEIVVCDSNTSVIYKWMDDGKLYRSTNKGSTFVQLTNFGTHNSGAANQNDSSGLYSANARLNGYKMACDPANPDVLEIGTNSGVLESTNASQGTGSTPTFAAVTGITAATNGGTGYNLAFDASSGLTGGKTNILYASSYGQGIFKRTTPAGSFSSVASAPTGTTNMAVSPNGLLWVADGTSGYKCTSCSTSPSWTTYTSGTLGINPNALAIDPNHSSSSSTEHVIFINNSANLSETTNSGTSWPATNLGTARSSATIPWLANTTESNLNSSLIAYNKATDVLWLGQGIGVWTAAGNVSSGPVTWTAATVGIEDLVANSVVSCDNATNAASGAAWDRALFPLRPGTTYPSNHGSTYDVAIGPAWSIDCAGGSSGDGLTTIGLERTSFGGLPGNGLTLLTELYGISTDNGTTWLPTPINTNNTNATLNTNAASAAGLTTLTFGSAIPAWVGPSATVTNTTHAGTVQAHGFVCDNGALACVSILRDKIYLDRAITGVGVSSGDTIKFGFSTSNYVFVKATTSSTASGAVLHFTSLGTNVVHPGMQAFDLTTTGAISTGGNGTTVLSTSAGDVTLSAAVSSTVASGDVIMFTDNGLGGGSVAVSTATNWCVTPSNNRAFPSCTQDGGQTYNLVDLAGIPRPLWGSTTNTSTTITVNDTSNVVTGSAAFICDNCDIAINGGGCIPANTTVSSITDSTHLVLSAAATCTTSANTDIFSLTPGWAGAYYNIARIITADRVTANKFYLYNYLTGKLFVSTDGGVTWPTVISTSLRSFGGTASWYGMAIKAVPGNAGNLFFSAAGIQNQAATFMRSTDSGATWNAVTNVDTVGAFGFGKPKPGGGGYPTIFIYGKVSGVFSLWRSDDNASTWVNLGTSNPVALAGTGDIDGDKNVYGQFYASGGSNGWYYGGLH